jgi:hypothetical protein
MVNYTSNSLPSAFIGINKNRLKTYSEVYKLTSVYLEDKQEFQIEIFNPTQKPVLAKIKLNGEYISVRGLVLKPGERVWLDRYIDENKKFKFSTYTVENNNYQVDNAIRNNGLVEIEFFDEIIKYNTSFNTGFVTTNNYFSTGTTAFPTYGNATFTSSVNNGSDFLDLDMNSSCCNSRGIVGSSGNTLKSKSLKETGRIEKGDYSNQSFNEVSMDFNLWSFHTVTYKIVPASEAKLTTDDVRVKYCTNCGKKITKTNWTFCPDCGTKI